MVRLRPRRRWIGGARKVASASAAAASLQPIRRERLIAGCRVALSAVILLALWLDPSEPVRYSRLAYGLMAGYTAYSVVLGLRVWSARATSRAFPFVVHAVDLALFCVLILATEGPTSPLFAYFVFAVAAATVRWQEEGTLWTAVIALAAFVAIGLATAARSGPDFEVDRFMIRTIYLGVVAVLLGYVGAYERRLRERVANLGNWPAVPSAQAPDLLRTVLEHAARGLAAPRAVLTWEDAEEPWCHLAVWSRGELSWRREAPGSFTPWAPADLATTAFFLADAPAPDAEARLITARGPQRWRRDPVPAALRAELGSGAVLSVPVEGESFEGRFFALDRPDMTTDELILGQILARQIAVRMDRLALFERFHRAGLAEERVRLARDLHDGVIQALAGASMRLESARRLVEADPGAARETVGEVQELLIHEQRELRELVGTLEESDSVRGPEADLQERLAALVHRIGRHWNLDIQLRNEVTDGAMPREVARHVFRLVQEALINASRHGSAAKATVELRELDGRVRLVVEDDGCGFPFRGRYDLEALAAARAGPVSLKRRVTACGGGMEIVSSEVGARIAIDLPCEPPADGAPA